MVLSVIGGEVLMILPKPPAFMCGKQAWVMKKVPRALIEVIRSYLQCAKFEDTAGLEGVCVENHPQKYLL